MTEGTRLLPHAQGAVDAVEAFTAAAAGISDPLHGTIRLGLIPTVAPYVLPTVLSELPLLLLDKGHCLRDQALAVCRKAGVRAELADTRATSLATAVQCVTGGSGVTLIPQSAVPVEAARSQLGLAQFAAPHPGRRIGLVFRSPSGREDSYRRLAGVIGELIATEQKVRLVK